MFYKRLKCKKPLVAAVSFGTTISTFANLNMKTAKRHLAITNAHKI